MINVLPVPLSQKDNVEKVRDQIGLILATNVDAQKQLAVAGGGDAIDWDIRVFLERTNPFQLFLDNLNQRPIGIINVWFEQTTYDLSMSHKHGQQATGATYNIDCIGYGVASDGPGAEHIAGDQQAAEAAQKVVRFARNVLDSAVNYRLQLPVGAVLRTWPGSVIMSEPPQGVSAAVHSIAARMKFDVSTTEYSPEDEKNPLCGIDIDIVRSSDGSIYAEADFDYGGG